MQDEHFSVHYPIDAVDCALAILIVAWSKEERQSSTTRSVCRLFVDPATLAVSASVSRLQTYIPDSSVLSQFDDLLNTTASCLDSFIDFFFLCDELKATFHRDSIFGRHVRRVSSFSAEAEFSSICTVYESFCEYIHGTTCPVDKSSTGCWRRHVSCTSGLMDAIRDAADRNFLVAEARIHRVFDEAGPLPRPGLVEYCLACLHSDFGHVDQAKLFLSQAVSRAHENNDDKLLAECGKLVSFPDVTLQRPPTSTVNSPSIAD